MYIEPNLAQEEVTEEDFVEDVFGVIEDFDAWW